MRQVRATDSTPGPSLPSCAPPRALTGLWFMVQKKEAIEPMMSVIEQVCTLIDTTDDVFYFKVRCA